MRPRTLGIVVAGGRGVRLGRGPKALVELAGRTLLDRACSTLAPLCDESVMAAPAGLELPVAPEQRVADLEGARGPISGIAAAMAARDFARALVLGVDFPLIPTATLAALAEALGRQTAAVPAPGGRLQPLVAAYAPAAGPALARAIEAGERSIVAAVAALGPVILDDAALARLGGGLVDWLNVNTPQDLAEAERLLAART